MNTQPDLEALAAASRWYARLAASDCTAADRAAFAAWQSDPVHARAFARTLALASLVSGSTDDPRLQALASRALPPASAGRRLLHRWQLPASLAAGLALAGVATQYAKPPAAPVTARTEFHATGPGERLTLTLDDGTVVHADVATRLSVRMDGTLREIRLEAGRALFSVAHDPARPFSVEAGGTRTTALGTQFQVEYRHAAVLVTLAEGSVRVGGGPAASPWLDTLAPGEQITLDTPVAEPHKREVDPQALTAWSRGRLQFRGTPLAEVIEEINRYAPAKVRLGDPTLADLPVGGNFIAGDSRPIVAALAAVLPLDVVESGDELLLFRRDASGH